MAQLELILQATTDATHAAAICTLLRRVAANSVLISVAFVREAGVDAIEEALRPVAARTRFFVGIRNGITSVQAIKRLLGLGSRIHVVDTGSRETIFHPKLYLAVEDDEEAALIVGSANLTHQGMYNNIEVSTLATLDLHNAEDRRFVGEITRSFDGLPHAHPRHVFRVNDEEEAEALLCAGQLADERVISAPLAATPVRGGKSDTLPRMRLRYVARPRIQRAVPRPAVPGRARPGRARRRGTAARTAPMPALPISEYYLVWESKDLTERDLNVPASARTHRTGSMLWKKGAMENVDQRHFFRGEIFHGLTWTRDPGRGHLERAAAMFELVVKNLNYGKFRLRLTHNAKTTSRAYQQRNAMTQVHWGDALPVVARRDLLGRTMYLYRKDANPPEFLIEID